MKKTLLILFLFSLDRISKIYLLELQSSGTDIDFYINSFLNIYLVWNNGIGFGLAAMESNIYYHILTTIIVFVNIVSKKREIYVKFFLYCTYDGSN